MLRNARRLRHVLSGHFLENGVCRGRAACTHPYHDRIALMAYGAKGIGIRCGCAGMIRRRRFPLLDPAKDPAGTAEDWRSDAFEEDHQPKHAGQMWPTPSHEPRSYPDNDNQRRDLPALCPCDSCPTGLHLAHVSTPLIDPSSVPMSRYFRSRSSRLISMRNSANSFALMPRSSIKCRISGSASPPNRRSTRSSTVSPMTLRAFTFGA